VKLDAPGIARFAADGTGVAHCPSSKHAAPDRDRAREGHARRGVPVGLGVDGSASNDAAHLVAEARTALLLQRLSISLKPFGCDRGPAAMTARDALALAPPGGTTGLGRRDIGHLAPGSCADLAIFDLRTAAFAGGAVHDPAGALLLRAPAPAAFTIVDGKVRVRRELRARALARAPRRPFKEARARLADAPSRTASQTPVRCLT